MATKTLNLAADLSLPVEVVTQTMAILAKRRAGKSYTMRRLAEQLFKAGQQVVIVDPKGDQWGVRSSADGKGPGLPIVILGGERGDAPLEVGAGDVVAKLVVEERVSVLIDLSLFRKREVAVFMTAFLETLYRLKAREVYRTPVMLVIDEADAIAPQKPQDGEERMLGAAEDIVRRGGQRGIGCVLVTQRSAVLNKNVLTQAEVLVALRTIAPQDLAAMNAWIDVHGTPEQRKQLMESLPSLPIGDAWFWSPGWPTADGIFKRVHVLPIETFDSGASPAPGVKRVEPKNLADVDLDKLKGQMAATIEQAKANDPRELKKLLAAKDKRISELEADVKVQRTSLHPSPGKPTPVLTDADRERLGAFSSELAAFRAELGASIQRSTSELRKAIEAELSIRIDQLSGQHAHKAQLAAARLEKAGITKILAKLEQVSAPVPVLAMHAGVKPATQAALVRTAQAIITPSRHHGTRESQGTGHRAEANLPPGERAVLTAAAMWPTDGVSRDQLGVLTGYKRSTRDAYIVRMQAKGLLAVAGGAIVATDAGIDALGPDFEPLPTGDALYQWWRDRLPDGERKCLDVLMANHGKPVDRETIDELTGFKRSTRDAYLSRLTARRLVESIGRGQVQPSKELFS